MSNFSLQDVLLSERKLNSVVSTKEEENKQTNLLKKVFNSEIKINLLDGSFFKGFLFH